MPLGKWVSIFDVYKLGWTRDEETKLNQVLVGMTLRVRCNCGKDTCIQPAPDWHETYIAAVAENGPGFIRVAHNPEGLESECINLFVARSSGNVELQVYAL